MAKSKIRVQNSEPRKYTLKELYVMYVKENYSMDLVSRVTGISLPLLSRIFQKFNFPELKLSYYDGNITGEKNKLEDAVPGFSVLTDNNKSAEDLFFEE